MRTRAIARPRELVVVAEAHPAACEVALDPGTTVLAQPPPNTSRDIT
jgi:hypothetical protein